jgi:hypothetical protein
MLAMAKSLGKFLLYAVSAVVVFYAATLLFNAI